MKEVISTPNAPGAIGPYSQAVRVGNLVFCSGQIPIVPETGEVLYGTAEEQAKLVLANCKALLEAAGVTLAQVVKTTVFLSDMNDFAAVNSVYAQAFAGTQFPARSAVEVARLPRDVKVEIEMIAAT